MNLSGGRTRDGGDIVGASVFYSHPQSDDENENVTQPIDTIDDNDEITKINDELKVS